MIDALATHYANALADIVFGPKSTIKPEEAVRELAEAEQAISGSKELQLALLSPAVNKQRKAAIINKLADGAGIDKTIRNFLAVIVSHRRTHELKAIRQSFQEVVDERLGWVRAEITSASELNPEQRNRIERALGVKIGKFIRAEYGVDPSLLGGIRARVASKEYDATLRGKLEGLRQQLLQAEL